MGDSQLSVLHVVPYFPPDRVGGVGEVASHLHEALIQRGHRSTVLTTGTTRTEEHVMRVASSPIPFIFASARYWRLTRAADIVHVHHGEAVGLLAATKVLGSGTPILLTLHASPRKIRKALRPYEVDGRRLGPDPGLLRRTLGMRVRFLLDRAAMALSDRLSFISRSTARDFLPAAQAERARVIYNGLPDPNDRPEKGGGDATERAAGPGGGEGKPAPEAVELLYVGVYNVRKRVRTLPLVLARVRSRAPNARLRIVGFGPDDHPDFLALARSVGVEDALVFEGRLRSSELPPYYRASRVLLVPSAYEGLPMVVMEAFQNGLPCVATRVSGLPEIVDHGRNGYLVDVDDPDQMAEAALRILEDGSLRDAMGEAARAVVRERFGVDRQVEEYLSLYRETIAAAEGGSRGTEAPQRTGSLD